MKIMMIKGADAIVLEDGTKTQSFHAGQEYSATQAWEKNILSGFVMAGLANEIGGNAAVPETKAIN